MEPAIEMNKNLEQKLQKIGSKMEADSREGDLSRARSITVGTCFGGITEIMMRGNNSYMWSPMQPVEVVELINQLAANIGCHVALKPRKDFASWRDWRITEEERIANNGWPPWVNDMAPYNQLGAKGMDPEIIKALDAGGKLNEVGGGSGGINPVAKLDPITRGANNGSGQPGASVFDYEAFLRSKENVMATEKPKNRRSTKRATKAS